MAPTTIAFLFSANLFKESETSTPVFPAAITTIIPFSITSSITALTATTSSPKVPTLKQTLTIWYPSLFCITLARAEIKSEV